MSSTRIRVVSYNLLSSHLSSAYFFTGVADAKYCDPEYRLQGILEKLTKEVENQSIVCLQEVSLLWTGKLTLFFDERNYSFLVSNYGHKFNGFMGVGIAYPRDHFKLKKSDFITVTDTKVGGWNKKMPLSQQNQDSNNTMFAKLLYPFVRVYQGLAQLLYQLKQYVLPSKKPEESSWEIAAKRINTMICLRLLPKVFENHNSTEGEFLIATYHMPCQFWDPKSMSIHTALTVQAIQMQSGNVYPYILCGDFNFKPNSPQYKFVTTGVLPERVDDPEDQELHGKVAQPEPLYPDDPFRFELKYGPLKSAYKSVYSREPEFTNYALTQNMKKTFAATLDYIFFANSGETQPNGKHPTLHVIDATDLSNQVSKTKTLKSLPSKDEYSDHLLIAADFKFEFC